MSRTQAFELGQDVAPLITEQVLAGSEAPDVAAYVSPIAELDVDADGIIRLLSEAVARYSPRDSEMDAWLAPRLHFLLRFPRRIAARQGLWRWITIVLAHSYVRHRWAAKGVITSARILGTGNFLRKNAMARLWWMAEIGRNGADYGLVRHLATDSGLEQYVLDSRFGHLRPSALAFCRVVLGRAKALPQKLTFNEARELSIQVNLLLSGTVLESLGAPGIDDLDQIDIAWFQEVPNVDDVVEWETARLRGPEDGASSEAEIRDYENWYASVAQAILERQRRKVASGGATEGVPAQA